MEKIVSLMEYGNTPQQVIIGTYVAWLMENTRNKLSGKLKCISENYINIFHFKKARLFRLEAFCLCSVLQDNPDVITSIHLKVTSS